MNEQELNLDIYTSIPVLCNDMEKLKRKQVIPQNVALIIKTLNERTQEEVGVLVESLDYRRFNMERYYLGRVEIKMWEKKDCFGIHSYGGQAKVEIKTREKEDIFLADLLITIDPNTKCGVLHLIILPPQIRVSYYLDCVSLNRLEIIQNEENLFNYLLKKYGIEKKGMSKNFLTICEKRNKIPNNWLAAVLFGEYCFEENEFLSTVSDREIKRILGEKKGWGQYQYATVYAYRNVFVQILDPNYQRNNKLCLECITLFYIELILLEEASIEKFNDKIIPFLIKINEHRPKKILQEINNILSEHSKSINFWNVQMSYPSSQKSIDYIRQAFDIEGKRAIFKRNQKELMMIYNIRSDMVEKAEATFISIIATIFTIIAAAFTLTSALDPATFDRNKFIITSLVCCSSIIALLLYRCYLQNKTRNKNNFVKIINDYFRRR